MKFLALTTLMVLILSANWGFATPAKPLCEAEMLPAVQKVVRVVTLGLGTQDLKAEDVEFMLSSSAKLLNPYRQKGRNEKNLAYRQILDRDLPKLNEEERKQARLALMQLIGQTAAREVLIQEARHDTRLVFAPKEVPLSRQVEVLFPNSTTSITQSDGKFLFGFWDQREGGIVTLDPHSREITRPKTYISETGTYKIDSKVDKEVAATLVRRPFDSQIVIEGFESRKTGITSNLPITLANIHIVRGPDNKKFVISRTENEIITYAVDEELKLSEVRRFAVPSDSLSVRNSDDGGVLAVAVHNSKNVVTIIKPLSDERPRIVRTKAHIMQASLYLASIDRFVVTIRTDRDKNGLQGEILFATSGSDEIFRTGRLKYPTLVNWFVTNSGRILFYLKSDSITPSDVSNGLTVYEVNVYEPFAPKFKKNPDEPKLIDRIFARFLKPQRILDSTYKVRSEAMTGLPSLYEDKEGRLYILIGSRHLSPQKNRVEIFEAEASLTSPITSFDVPPDTGEIHQVEVGELNVTSSVYFMITGTQRSKIYADWTTPREVLSVPDLSFLEPSTQDINGQFYFVGFISSAQNHGLTGQIKLFRMFSNGEDLR